MSIKVNCCQLQMGGDYLQAEIFPFLKKPYLVIEDLLDWLLEI